MHPHVLPMSCTPLHLALASPLLVGTSVLELHAAKFYLELADIVSTTKKGLLC
jgi:hypothetical protein